MPIGKQHSLEEVELVKSELEVERHTTVEERGHRMLVVAG